MRQHIPPNITMAERTLPRVDRRGYNSIKNWGLAYAGYTRMWNNVKEFIVNSAPISSRVSHVEEGYFAWYMRHTVRQSSPPQGYELGRGYQPSNPAAWRIVLENAEYIQVEAMRHNVPHIANHARMLENVARTHIGITGQTYDAPPFVGATSDPYPMRVEGRRRTTIQGGDSIVQHDEVGPSTVHGAELGHSIAPETQFCPSSSSFPQDVYGPSHVGTSVFGDFSTMSYTQLVNMPTSSDPSQSCYSGGVFNHANIEQRPSYNASPVPFGLWSTRGDDLPGSSSSDRQPELYESHQSEEEQPRRRGQRVRRPRDCGTGGHLGQH